MKPLATAVALFLIAGCSPGQAHTVIIVDADRSRVVTSQSRIPRVLLRQAGIQITPSDAILVNGYEAGLDQVPPGEEALTIQVRRAVQISVNGKATVTTADSVGEALQTLGYSLYAADIVAPSAETSVSQGLAVQLTPSTVFSVRVDDRQLNARAGPAQTGTALAEAGIPLIGLDASRPAMDQAMPEDGQIRVDHVTEALKLTETAIAYTTDIRDSSEVALGQQKIVQPGQAGLAMTRLRIRYLNGVEVSRQLEPETIVRPPQDRVVLRGLKVVPTSAAVDGLNLQYWRVLQMYATVYSPCNSGTGGCSYGTASGLRAGKGVVAVDPSLFSYLNGQRLYIPGYGYAVVGDVGGGYIVERSLGISRYRWIDLGFDDADVPDMTGWVTVYFLEPAPATIPDALK